MTDRKQTPVKLDDLKVAVRAAVFVKDVVVPQLTSMSQQAIDVAAMLATGAMDSDQLEPNALKALIDAGKALDRLAKHYAQIMQPDGCGDPDCADCKADGVGPGVVSPPSGLQ